MEILSINHLAEHFGVKTVDKSDLECKLSEMAKQPIALSLCENGIVAFSFNERRSVYRLVSCLYPFDSKYIDDFVSMIANENIKRVIDALSIPSDSCPYAPDSGCGWKWDSVPAQ